METHMAKNTIGAIASISLLMLLAITLMLFANALPFFGEYKLSDFLLGNRWNPTQEPPEFGILPLLWGSVIVTVIALLFALPVGIACALYLNGVAPTKLREALKPIIELLGSVPSVVYGLFGLTLLAPFFQRILSLTIGQCAFTAGITLGLMALPIVVSVSEDALSSVPKDYNEASLALGATRWETLTKVVFPSARSGIWAAILLALGRTIGETMTVLMVAGGAAQIALSPFKPVRTMTATIAAEMGETPQGSLHFHALFAVGVLLFVITFVINLIANKYATKSVK